MNLIEIIPTVLMQGEDFMGSIAVPIYGHERPSSDYFNSNLMLHAFVVANIGSKTNYVWCFDERGQGKGADCMCSLRMKYHILQWDHYRDKERRPTVSISVLDNCCAQIKSQLTMKFYCLLILNYF